MTTETKPHKHAEQIKAWADGHEIQVRYNWKDNWEDINGNPSWYPENEYRVKPVPPKDYSKFAGLYVAGGYHAIKGVWVDSSWVRQFIKDSDNLWLICDKLELVFDGTTRELKQVNIIKDKHATK